MLNQSMAVMSNLIPYNVSLHLKHFKVIRGHVAPNYQINSSVSKMI